MICWDPQPCRQPSGWWAGVHSCLAWLLLWESAMLLSPRINTSLQTSSAPTQAGTGVGHQGRRRFCMFLSVTALVRGCVGEDAWPWATGSCLWRVSSVGCWAPPVGRLHLLILPPGTVDVVSAGVGQDPGGQRFARGTELRGDGVRLPPGHISFCFLSPLSWRGQVGGAWPLQEACGCLCSPGLCSQRRGEASRLIPSTAAGSLLPFLAMSKYVSSQIRNLTVFG